jgi:hypothetical protein
MTTRDNEPQPGRENDWYHGASAEDRQEYDAFGPWVSPIRSIEEMPKRFRVSFDENAGAAFMFKIPINAERRNLRPGMDLYCTVVAIHPDRVVLLEWNGEEVESHVVRMDAVQAIRSYQNLLQSQLSLLIDDGSSACVEYNSVSSDLMDEAILFLQRHVAALTPETRGEEASAAGQEVEAIEDHFYLSLWEDSKRRCPDARVLHWEAPGIRCRDTSGWRRYSLGCLVLYEAGTLVVLGRGRFMRKWHEAIYSREELFVPLASVVAVETTSRPAGHNETVPVTRLMLRGHVVELELFAPADRLHRFLGSNVAAFVAKPAEVPV